MEENNFKVGDKVRVTSANAVDAQHGISVGMAGEVKEVAARFSAAGEDGVFVHFGKQIAPAVGASQRLIRGGAYVMCGHKLEPAPFEVPASQFYVRAHDVEEYRVDVDGLFYSLTNIPSGNHWPKHAETRKIPELFADGSWKLIDPPAPAVDPVVAATAEVQRLLREQDAANSERREAWVVLEAAEKKLRNIGKALNEAKRALGVAMHDAAGVTYTL